MSPILQVASLLPVKWRSEIATGKTLEILLNSFEELGNAALIIAAARVADEQVVSHGERGGKIRGGEISVPRVTKPVGHDRPCGSFYRDAEPLQETRARKFQKSFTPKVETALMFYVLIAWLWMDGQFLVKSHEPRHAFFTDFGNLLIFGDLMANTSVNSSPINLLSSRLLPASSESSR